MAASPPALLVISTDRRGTGRTVAIAALWALGVVAIALAVPGMPAWLVGLLLAVPSGFLGGKLARHQGPLAEYDSADRTITVHDRWWGVRRVHPRPGYERLEYSSADREIVEVAANGKRRRVRIDSWEADPKDWGAFVERFQRDHACEERDVTADE